MIGFLLRLAISAFGLWVASKLLAGMYFDSTGTLLLAAFLLGVVNAIVRPLLILLTLPLTIVTLGLFLFVVNALMFWLVAEVVKGFTVSGFVAALVGSVLYSLITLVVSWLVGGKK